MQSLARDVAHALLATGAVGFDFDQPVIFKSGIRAPVYIDNRRLPYHPSEWRVVVNALHQHLQLYITNYDVIAGMEVAGIPHSAALAFTTRTSSVFVRKQPKNHGLGRRVEGGDVRGKRVVLIEDQITTGGSSLSGIEALRADGAIVEDCLTITSYGFQEAIEAFTNSGVCLHTLVTFPVMLEVARSLNHITDAQATIARDWLADPYGWSERNAS